MVVVTVVVLVLISLIILLLLLFIYFNLDGLSINHCGYMNSNIPLYQIDVI